MQLISGFTAFKMLQILLELGHEVSAVALGEMLEQGEKRDIFIMNGAVLILSVYFVLFLWFTY